MSKLKIIGIINDLGKKDWGGCVYKICQTLKAEAHGNIPKIIIVEHKSDEVKTDK